MKLKLFTILGSGLLVMALPIVIQAATINGTVTYEDTGAPVTNAWVNVWPDNGGDGGGEATDENGEYEMTIENIEAGDTFYWSIDAAIDFSDYDQVSDLDWAGTSSYDPITMEEDEAYELNIEVGRTNAILTGSIVNENGQAITSVPGNIQLSNEENEYWGYTNEDGTYYINLISGTYNTYFYADTYENEDLQRYYYLDEGDTTSISVGSNNLDITLGEKTAYADVTVVDQDKDPLEGVWVEMYAENSWSNSETDENGQARLWIKSDVWYESNVWSNDYIFNGEPQKVKLADNESTSFTFTLQSPDATINASILDENGGLVDTFGNAWCHDENYYQNYNGDLNNGTGSIPILVGDNESFSGTCHLWVSDDNLGAASPASVEVASGQTANISFTLVPKDATVKVWVKDTNGNVLDEINNGEVYVWNEETDSWYGEQFEEGDNGQKDIAVVPGEYTGGVWFEDNSYIPLWSMNNSKVEVASGETTNLVMTVLAATGSLTGTVTDPEGNPAPYGWVYCGNWQEMNMAGDFETGIIIDAGGEIRDGEFSISLAAGHEYMCGVGLPSEYTEQGWMSPEEKTLTYESEGDELESLDFQFTQADSTVSGTVAVNSQVTTINSVDDLERVWCWSWSEDGGHSYSETNVGENYTLNLTSGRTWNIGCDAQEGNNWYWTEEARIEVDEAGNYSQDLNLTLADNWVIYDSVSETFDSTSSKTIALGDGTTLSIPANSLATSGNVTVTATPQTQIVYTGDKLVNVPWNFEAFNSDNQLIESFNSNVTITINYSQEAVEAIGIEESEILGKYYDEDSGTWRTPDNITQDTENNTITVQTNHFTQYGVTYNAKASGSAVDTPTNLRTTDRNVRTTTLKWNGDGDYYKVQLKTKAGDKVKTYKNVSKKKKVVKKKLTKSNQAYKFRVKACSSDDVCSDYSAYKKFRTKPAKVINLNFDEDTNKLTWKKIRGKNITYRIRVMDEDGKKLRVYKTNKKSKDLSSLLEEGQTYKVKIKAKYDSKNLGTWSEVETIEL